MDIGFRSYEWHDDELYVHTESGFVRTTLSEIADDIPRQALACLSAKRAWKVQPAHNDTTIIGVKSDADADWCVDTMSGWHITSAIKWGEDASGGSIFFKRTHR